MKTFFFVCCLLLISTLIFQCCKKDSEEEPSIPVCRVQTLTQASVITSFVYDPLNRVSKAAYSDGAVEEYTYKGDTTRILRTEGGLFTSRKIITNNAQGLATQVRIEDNPAGTSGVIINYQYNGTELVQSIQKAIGSASSTVTVYSWSAGNLTELRSGSSITTLDYYTDKLSQPGNYLEAVNLVQGYTIFKTKNLVKTIAAGGSPATITYIFDSDNNISQAVFTGSTNDAIGFTYQCK